MKIASRYSAFSLRRDLPFPSTPDPRYLGSLRILILLALLVIGSASALHAQTVGVPEVEEAEAFAPGDIAVSGFAGVRLQSDGIAPGVDPISKSVIDPDGVTLRIYDAPVRGTPAAGQVITPPAVFELRAREIGHVFALTFDAGSPDGAVPSALYAAATSAFGLNIVGPDKDGDGKPDRLSKGAPGATFMQGQFGGQPGAGPGTIWKIDRATGQLSIFANLQTNGADNSGPGIGGLAIDPASRTLYASDLDTGLIHRFSIAKGGASSGVFDHGFVARSVRGKPLVKDDRSRLDITSPNFDPAKPDTWMFTAPSRRVHGLAVHDRRLYYAVAEGAEIWSVGLAADGAFEIDPRFEVGIGGDPNTPLTGIVFDRAGRMIVAQRGSLQNPADYSQFVGPGETKVLRFTPNAGGDAGRWKLEIDEYAVGNSDSGRSSSGGIATHFGFKPDGSIDVSSCDGTLAVTADALGEKRATQGVQLADIGLVRPANLPPRQSVYIDWDARQDDPQVRGYVGGVASFAQCDGGAGFPAVAQGEGAGLPPIAGDLPVVDPGTGDSTAPPVVDPTLPPIEDGADAPLQVVKTAEVATCSPKGGCAFNISVTNPNPAEVAGPIVIDEQIDAAQAVMTGTPNAPWECTKAAPFTCTHPGPIGPNETINMRVVFAPNTPPEITTVKNCAIVQGAAAATPEQCPTIALDPNAPVQTGPIIVTKTSTSECTPNTPCSFAINVTNDSDTDVKGPIVIDEQIDAPAAQLSGEPNAPWTCTKVAPFQCTHPGPLAAKQSVDLQLAFIPNTALAQKTLKNCAIVKQPPPAAPANQFAPQKKTEAPFLFGKSLAQHANFSVPPMGNHQGLLLFTGGAGGNIGGVSCLKRKALPAFSVRQANDVAITLSNVGTDVAGNIVGSATLFMSKKGSFNGTFDGTNLNYKITWSDGTVSTYRGTFDAQGNLSGTTRNGTTGEVLTFKGLQPWPCALTSPCNDYAEKAMAQVAEFQQLGCGPLPGNMSPKREDHVNFCMAGNLAGPLENEHAARDKQIADCKASKAPPPVEPANDNPVPAEPADPGKPPEPAAAPAPEQCAIVPIGPANGPNLKLTKTADPCTLNAAKARFECNFVITIANTGNAPFSGPVSIFDQSPIVDGITIGMTTVPPWSCPSQGDPNAGNRLCTNKDVKLDPQASTTLPLQVTVPSNMTGLCVVQNGAFIKTPRGGAPDDPNSNAIPDDDFAPTIAATLPNKNCTPTNLNLAKTATPDCVQNAAGNFVCSYKLSVANAGVSPFNDKIEILDSFPDFISMTQTPGGQLTCKSPAAGQAGANSTVTCESADKVTLTPGGPPAVVDLSFEVLPTRATPEACKLENSAVLIKPVAGSVGNTAGTDDRATAIAKIPMVPGPNGEVPCDPPSLKLSKIANPQQCAQAAGGFRCRYDVAVTSTGPDPFHGPLMLQDTLPAGSKLEKATGAGWTCSGDSVVKCAHEFVTIPVGDKLGVNVSVLVPDANVKPGSCQVSNSASLVLASGPLKGQSFNASATATIQSPLCTAPTTPSTAPVKSNCFGGMALTPAGTCACPPDTAFNGRSCSGITPPSSPIEPSAVIAVPPVVTTPPVVISPPPLGCLGGMVLKAGSCVCPTGTRFAGRSCIVDEGSGGSYPSKSIEDVKPEPRPKTRPPKDDPELRCPALRPIGDYPDCCPRGTRFSRGACRSTQVDEPSPAKKERPQCSGRRPIGDYPDCCPIGTSFKRGACRPNRQDPTPVQEERKICPPGRPVGQYPDCCPLGTKFIGGACRRMGIPPPDPKPQPQPQPQPGPFVKICPNGKKVFGKYAQCPDSKSTLPPARCPSTMTGTPPNCRTKPDVKCPAGTRKVYKNSQVVCERMAPPPPVTPNCGSGSVYNPTSKSCERLNPR